MARPERNNIDYFPFMCDEGKKTFYIEETYGNDGFATFVKLLRELAKTDYHYLDLSQSKTLMFLSAKCKVSKETLENIISDLVDLGKFDELLWRENKIIWCADFIESIQDAYKKRNNKCITYDGLLTLLEGLGVRKPSKSTTTVPVNPQSKVKESKVKESKEDDAENFSSKNFDDDFKNFQILVLSKIESYDFEKNINEISQSLEIEKNQNRKVYLSQCLNFLRDQKRKKVAPKKEKTHEAFADELIFLNENTQWRETIFMQHKITEIQLKQKLRDFNVMLLAKKKIHSSERSYIDHFTNWLPTQLKNKASPQIDTTVKTPVTNRGN